MDFDTNLVRIMDFAEKGNGYLDFLKLVSAIRIFDVDLLYQLHTNFKAYYSNDPEAQPSYIVVNDIIQSSLTKRVSNTLFMMKRDIRNILESELLDKEKQDLRDFIEEYQKRHSNNKQWEQL